ncbi:MAG: hypothetical protein ACOH2V_13555 [Candidatus Saccharimonadaceae bacterium]
MQEKEKLKKLLDIIEELLKIKGNEWLIDALMEKIKAVSPIEEIAKHSLIKDIHEYCVENIIEKQANNFYDEFCLEEIKIVLIKDFVKMEHERRRDDFENFALSVYQQIENITNFLFDNYILKIWDSEKNNVAIESYNKNLKCQTKLLLENLIFENSKDRIWYANRKFRAVLFFYYFNKNIRNEYIFNSIFYAEDEIYQIRNQNHRGSKPSDYQLKSLKKIIGKESKYYFKFYGFLEDFISNINESQKNSGYKNNIQPSKNKTQNILIENNQAIKE